MGLNLSIVHKITSIADLEHLTKALKETMTLQAQIQLKDDIRRLGDKKKNLKIEITALEMQKQGLKPPTDEEKATSLKEIDVGEEEAVEPSSLEGDARRLIEEITETPAEEQEIPQDVENSPDLPET